MSEREPGKVRKLIQSAAEVVGIGGLSFLKNEPIEIKYKERRRPYRPWNETTLQVEFSNEDDAAYIRVNDNTEVARTEIVTNGLQIDFDTDGDVVGIELMGYNLKQAKNKIPPHSNPK